MAKRPTKAEKEALDAAAAAEAEKIINSDVDANTDDEVAKKVRASNSAKPRDPGDAIQKLKSIALSYPQQTADEQVCFGRASLKFTLGELRDIAGLPRKNG